MKFEVVGGLDLVFTIGWSETSSDGLGVGGRMRSGGALGIGKRLRRIGVALRLPMSSSTYEAREPFLVAILLAFVFCRLTPVSENIVIVSTEVEIDDDRIEAVGERAMAAFEKVDVLFERFI